MDKIKLTYKDAGVDLESGYKVERNIQSLADRFKRPEVISNIGGFAGMFELKKYTKPVLVSSADGVGTKLKIASMVNKHDTIGIDLVAMCVNDIITCGAEPLFFLDYIATGKINVDSLNDIAKGIVTGCKEAGCSLIGGETSEMPGVYCNNEYDLAGFTVGVVEKDHIIDAKNVESGDIIIGLASSGIHSNGFSLCRKLFFEHNKFSPFSYINCLNRPLFEELLEPTKIYVKPVLEIIREFEIKSIANITGGGFIKNIPRSIPFEYQANIFHSSWEIPTIFEIIQNMADLEQIEMFNVFNMGIGMTLIVKDKEADEILKSLSNKNCQAYKIGKISRKKTDQRIAFVDNK